MTATSVHPGPPHLPTPQCAWDPITPAPASSGRGSLRAPPPAVLHFFFPTSSFRHHPSGVVPTQRVHQVLGGAGKEQSSCCPLPPAARPTFLWPPPWACCTHSLPGQGTHSTHPKGGMSCKEGSTPWTCTLTIGVWTTGPGGDGGSWGHGTLLDPLALLSCRHHCHLPMGGLQPPGAA